MGHRYDFFSISQSSVSSALKFYVLYIFVCCMFCTDKGDTMLLRIFLVFMSFVMYFNPTALK